MCAGSGASTHAQPTQAQPTPNAFASGPMGSDFATFPTINGDRGTALPVQTDFKSSFDAEPAANGSLI
jgi:hypothetical protein